jgi:hypothetical protein
LVSTGIQAAIGTEFDINNPDQVYCGLLCMRLGNILDIMSKRKILEDTLKKAARDGKITCSALRHIAEKSNVTYRLAGKVADELKIKIKNCDLGCF